MIKKNCKRKSIIALMLLLYAIFIMGGTTFADNDNQGEDTIAPIASIHTNGIIITNQNTIRVYVDATDEDSGVREVQIKGFYGETGSASCFTGRSCNTF